MSRSQNALFRGLVLVGIVAVALLLYKANYDQMGWWVKPLFAAWITLLTILLRTVQVRNLSKQLKSSPSAQGNHVWSFSDDGIKVMGPLSTGEIKWEGIVKARESKTDFFFYTTKRFALFLPKRVLAGDPKTVDLRQMIAKQLGDKARLISQGVT
jgi:hypothetical protein